jgi:hypothetical protein
LPYSTPSPTEPGDIAMSTIKINEYAGAILGVPGRFHNAVIWPQNPQLWASQTWISEGRKVKGYGTNGVMHVEMRYDDNCRNGHHSFAITASVYTTESRARRDIAAGGCMHDEIEKVFPELAPLIKWHLCASDGPMHYIANTVYHASDRDHNGLRKGERRQIRNGRTGLPSWRLAFVDAQGNEVDKPEAHPDSETVPECDIRLVYLPWERIGEGKERQFDHARSCAVWPDATDAELSVPSDELREVLAARLPQLLADFRKAMESTGFVWSP